MTKMLVVGLGQIGISLLNVLNEKYEVYGIDRDDKLELTGLDVMHVCIPYSDKFVEIVKNYEKEYNPKIVIVHGTVKPGTCDKHGWTYSFTRGVHPHLEEGIKTFVKYFGGGNATESARVFTNLGIKTRVVKDAKTAESMKVWSTTQYGWNIILQKEIKKWCDKEGVDFHSVYTEANKTYNEGYEALGMPEMKKYILRDMPGKILGHCVIPNLDLFDSDINVIIKAMNSRLDE